MTPNMSKKTNLLWKTGMAVAWTAVAAAYYIEVPEVRRTVHDHLRWVREYFSPTTPTSKPAPAPAIVETPSVLVPTPVEPSVPAPAPESEPVKIEPTVARAPEPALVPPIAEPPVAALDLQALAADPARPRTVRLKQSVTFPAVQDARVIGKLLLPAGSVVNLARISGRKLGVEYRGGGAWVELEHTDLLEQLHPARKLLSATP
jgi:hypothetical protein